MNMITVLLGATTLLLVVAVALSFGSMNKRTDSAEVAKLKAEIAALQDAERNLVLPPAGSNLPNVPAAAPIPFAPQPGVVTQANPTIATPAPAPGPIDPDPNAVPELGDEEGIAKLEAEIREAELRHHELAAKNEALERENGVLKGEQGLITKPRLESDRKSRARASTIKAAFLQARIVQWAADDGFGVAEIHRPDLQVGTILAVRRQTGIYGQVKVDQIYAAENQAIVNPILGTFPEGGANGIDLKIGDDLIVPPL